MLCVQQMIRVNPEIPGLILRLDGEDILALAQHPPAVELNGRVQRLPRRIHARPHGIGGIGLFIVPPADQHLSLLNAHNPYLVRSAGLCQLAHGNVPHIHGDVVHRLGKVAGAYREESSSRFHGQLARQHLRCDIGHMDTNRPVEIGVGYADAVFALMDIQLQRRIQFFDILIIEAERQASGLTGSEMHQKMALHVRLF